jgi:hypothetical protein
MSDDTGQLESQCGKFASTRYRELTLPHPGCPGVYLAASSPIRKADPWDVREFPV